jgi:hypothetical protein
MLVSVGELERISRRTSDTTTLSFTISEYECLEAKQIRLFVCSNLRV